MKRLFALLCVMACLLWAGVASAVSFTADGQATDVIRVEDGDTVNWTASTDDTDGIIEVQVTSSPTVGNWQGLQTITTATQSGSILNEGNPKWYRVYCKNFETDAVMTGTITLAERTLDTWKTKDGRTVLSITESGIVLAGDATIASAGDIVRVYRKRFTAGEVNAVGGTELLPAVGGFKYRMVSCQAIAIGGNAATVTTVDILGTQTNSVKLVAFGQAQLTRSAVLTAGSTGGTVLADGASFEACDANTAIKISKTGESIATATYVDIIFEYVLDAA